MASPVAWLRGHASSARAFLVLFQSWQVEGMSTEVLSTGCSFYKSCWTVDLVTPFRSSGLQFLLVLLDCGPVTVFAVPLLEFSLKS